MDFHVTKTPLEKLKVDVVFIGCWQKKKDKDDKGIAVLQKIPSATSIDRTLDGLLTKTIKEEAFRGETCEYKVIRTAGRLPCRAIVLVGLGEQKDFDLDTSRQAGAKIAFVTNELNAADIALPIQKESFKEFAAPLRTRALAEGMILGSYKFERYKDKKDIEPDTLRSVHFSTLYANDKINAEVKRAGIVAKAVCMARDMVNLPAKDMTPKDLAQKAREIALNRKLRCTVWGKNEIEKEKMGLFLAVARGSENEPRFIHIHYKPARAKAKIALVGKGVTFDSGGYDLKPGRHMLTMKNDMAGGAACLAVIDIAAQLKMAVELDVYIPATDNMIDAKAEVPGNVIRSRSGKTVEIISTDAEGRLILADAISYAVDKKPDYLIDLATLTGCVLYALGEKYTAILGNNQKLVEKYISASKLENEPAWQLPLAKEYKRGIKDGIADLKNSAKTKADTIAGGLFLQEFVGDTKWMHLDIAESAWTEDGRGYYSEGATGSPIRTLVRMLEGF